jgi:hypothetical protein
LLIVLSIATYCNANGYGLGYGSLGSVGYGGIGYGVGAHGVIPAAIKSSRHVEVKPVHLPQDPIYPQLIEVAPIDMPVKIIYNSKSSSVFVEQIHTPGIQNCE